MDKDEIKKCIYILTGDTHEEKLTDEISDIITNMDSAVKNEYEKKYYNTLRNILSDIDMSKPLSKEQRAEILLKMKNSLSEEDRKGFDKFLNIMKLYLASGLF
ncbi:MAG: hypothetical protein E7218_05190 [Anaerofustis stercorihominis]|nr:hypothetical protein [Anaerofustis stercorihominis]